MHVESQWNVYFLSSLLACRDIPLIAAPRPAIHAEPKPNAGTHMIDAVNGAATTIADEPTYCST